MSVDDPSLSVVVPTYQRRKTLPDILAPLLDSQVVDRVVVVNDGSDDGTAALLEEMATVHSHLTVINQTNAGRQAARTAGVAQVDSDLVLLLDDDVLVNEEILTMHRDLHRDKPRLLVEGYMPIDTDSDEDETGTLIYAAEYLGRCRRLVEGGLDPINQLWGGNVSLPTAVAAEVMAGPEFPANFCEDTHFGLECAKRGLSGHFDDRFPARHLHHRATAGSLREAAEQGLGRACLHRLHPELGEFDPAVYVGGFGAAVPVANAGGRIVAGHRDSLGRLIDHRLQRLPLKFRLIGVRILRKLALVEGAKRTSGDA